MDATPVYDDLPTERPGRQKAAELLEAARVALRSLGEEEAKERGVQDALWFIHAAQVALDHVEITNLDERRLAAFSQVLRDRRNKAGLSQPELAEAAGLSLTTIKNIENQRQVPSRATLQRLMAVAVLRLRPDDVRRPGEAREPFTSNSWLSLDYDPVLLGTNLARSVNGDGGYLEQTVHYLDSQSAAMWIELSDSGRYAQAFRDSFPLDRAAARIAKLLAGAERVELVALGAGDGKLEVRLTQHLSDRSELPQPLRLLLLDISHPLLGSAYRHAVDMLEPRGVVIRTLHADFHHLPRYPQLHYDPPGAPRRRRVFLLLGNTLANLDNEMRFFAQLHSCTAPGDLVLVDCQLCYAPADRPDEIHRMDPPIRDGSPSREHVNWLSGLFYRYRRDAAQVAIRTELGPASTVPGSYEAEAVALVTDYDGRTHRFSAWRVRRYDPERLSQAFARLGWATELLLRYGPEGREVSAVLLLRRV